MHISRVVTEDAALDSLLSQDELLIPLQTEVMSVRIEETDSRRVQGFPYTHEINHSFLVDHGGAHPYSQVNPYGRAPDNGMKDQPIDTQERSLLGFHDLPASSYVFRSLRRGLDQTIPVGDSAFFKLPVIALERL